MVRLGQNFLADPNLLEAIVRESDVGAEDVVLEVGAGEGVLTERLADVASKVHVIEIDRRLEEGLAKAIARPNVDLHWDDAMKFDLTTLDPKPNAMVANLPYSVATPVILRTIEQLPSIDRWTVMVQLEIAQRIQAGPGSRVYGSPSAVIQLATEARILRRVDRAVFVPRPRVDSAVLQLSRIGPAPDPATHLLIRRAFAHRRKSMARSVELAAPGSLHTVRAALVAIGLPENARAETLAPGQFSEVARLLGESK